MVGRVRLIVASLLRVIALVPASQGHRSAPVLLAPIGPGIRLDPWTVYPLQVPTFHNPSYGIPSIPDSDVSGRYVGSANAWAIESGSAVPGDYRQQLVPDGQILCDLESWNGSPLDEDRVDGQPGPGLAPDSAWDDGGFGGACHSGGGCPSAVAHAVDAVLGRDVWIGAGCDFLTSYDAANMAQSTGSCALEATIGQDLTGEVVCAVKAASCLLQVCLGQMASCGPDGVVDEINFGSGGTGVVYPRGDVTWGCPGMGSAVAMTFTWAVVSAADTNSDRLPDQVTVESVGQPTQGYIWGTGTFPAPNPPSGPQVFTGFLAVDGI